MDRVRYLAWAEQQLAFWGEGNTVERPSEASRKTEIRPGCQLSLEATYEDRLRVELSTDDEDRRGQWSEVFRATSAGEPPYPPGLPPEDAGELDFLVSASGEEGSLRFEWLCLGSDYIEQLDTVMSCICWLIRLCALEDRD